MDLVKACAASVQKECDRWHKEIDEMHRELNICLDNVRQLIAQRPTLRIKDIQWSQDVARQKCGTAPLTVFVTFDLGTEHCFAIESWSGRVIIKVWVHKVGSNNCDSIDDAIECLLTAVAQRHCF